MTAIDKRLPTWLSGKETPTKYRGYRRHGFNLWVRKIRCSRKWQPTPVFLPVKSHGQDPGGLLSIRVAKSWTWLSNWVSTHTHTQTHTSESSWASTSEKHLFKVTLSSPTLLVGVSNLQFANCNLCLLFKLLSQLLHLQNENDFWL